MQSFWLYLELVSCCKPPTSSLISCRTSWLIQEPWLPRTARLLRKLRREKRLDWKGGEETGSQELASSQDLSWARKQLDKVAAQRLAGPAWLSEPHSWHQEPPAMLHSADARIVCSQEQLQDLLLRLEEGSLSLSTELREGVEFYLSQHLSGCANGTCSAVPFPQQGLRMGRWSLKRSFT